MFSLLYYHERELTIVKVKTNASRGGSGDEGNRKIEREKGGNIKRVNTPKKQMIMYIMCSSDVRSTKSTGPD